MEQIKDEITILMDKEVYILILYQLEDKVHFYSPNYKPKQSYVFQYDSYEDLKRHVSNLISIIPLSLDFNKIGIELKCNGKRFAFLKQLDRYQMVNRIMFLILSNDARNLKLNFDENKKVNDLTIEQELDHLKLSKDSHLANLNSDYNKKNLDINMISHKDHWTKSISSIYMKARINLQLDKIIKYVYLKNIEHFIKRLELYPTLDQYLKKETKILFKTFLFPHCIEKNLDPYRSACIEVFIFKKNDKERSEREDFIIFPNEIFRSKIKEDVRFFIDPLTNMKFAKYEPQKYSSYLELTNPNQVNEITIDGIEIKPFDILHIVRYMYTFSDTNIELSAEIIAQEYGNWNTSSYYVSLNIQNISVGNRHRSYLVESGLKGKYKSLIHIHPKCYDRLCSPPSRSDFEAIKGHCKGDHFVIDIVGSVLWIYYLSLEGLNEFEWSQYFQYVDRVMSGNITMLEFRNKVYKIKICEEAPVITVDYWNIVFPDDPQLTDIEMHDILGDWDILDAIGNWDIHKI